MAGGKFKKILRKVAPGLLSLIPVVGPMLGAVAGGVGKYLDAKDADRDRQNAAMAQGIASTPQGQDAMAQQAVMSGMNLGGGFAAQPASAGVAGGGGGNDGIAQLAQGNLYEANVSSPSGISGLSSQGRDVAYAAQGGPIYMARGGIAAMAPQQYAAGGKFLSGPGDGTSDSIRANIEGKQEARLADGEFVIPADVVSHIGNGSSKAGAKKLYKMMDNIRRARTGNPKMGKTIKAEKYLPA